ncbi:hypothetical protein MKW98_029944 [Papaver atlanticum]|uniref:Uncharacterized protein n=1 Tax=Papaver atlanticum TaxID=357466 RepID=A0AAD4XZK9_9MAGN|nr:hypothetical protein MKW98_029944 [Papaver atlanticum]
MLLNPYFNHVHDRNQREQFITQSFLAGGAALSTMEWVRPETRNNKPWRPPPEGITKINYDAWYKVGEIGVGLDF